MGYLHYVKELWKKPKENLGEIYKNYIISWRTEPNTVRLVRPTRLDRARNLGWKAKQGFIIVRQKVSRGGRMRPTIKHGRRPKHNHQVKILSRNYQAIAEERANAKYVNCEVLNSYWVGQDGKNIWYEVILLDRAHPQILANPVLANIVAKKRRSTRGLTSAGRKHRGLRNKGIGAEKIRPSRKANGRRH